MTFGHIRWGTSANSPPCSLAHRAASVIQPEATLVGGLREAHKVCALAAAWGIDVSPHCGGLTAVGIAANLHPSATSPTFTLLEYDASPEQPLGDQLLTE